MTGRCARAVSAWPGHRKKEGVSTPRDPAAPSKRWCDTRLGQTRLGQNPLNPCGAARFVAFFPSWGPRAFRVDPRRHCRQPDGIPPLQPCGAVRFVAFFPSWGPPAFHVDPKRHCRQPDAIPPLHPCGAVRFVAFFPSCGCCGPGWALLTSGPVLESAVDEEQLSSYLKRPVSIGDARPDLLASRHRPRRLAASYQQIATSHRQPATNNQLPVARCKQPQTKHQKPPRVFI